MLNPVDIAFGFLKEIRLAWERFEANSLPLQAIKLILEELKEKRI